MARPQSAAAGTRPAAPAAVMSPEEARKVGEFRGLAAGGGAGGAGAGGRPGSAVAAARDPLVARRMEAEIQRDEVLGAVLRDLFPEASNSAARAAVAQPVCPSRLLLLLLRRRWPDRLSSRRLFALLAPYPSLHEMCASNCWASL